MEEEAQLASDDDKKESSQKIIICLTPPEDGEPDTPCKSSDPNESEDKVTLDDILTVIGEFGIHQKWVYFLFSVPFLCSSMQLMGWVFIGAVLPHRCKIPGEEAPYAFHLNDTEIASYGYAPVGSCQLRHLADDTVRDCFDSHGFVYDRSEIEDSVVADWDLVCHNDGWRATVGAAPMVGYLVGGLVLGTLSDMLGRKITFLISTVLQLISGLGTAFAPEYYTFTIARGLVGFAISGIDATCFVLGMELVGPSKRTVAGIVCWFFETGGLLLAVTLALFLNFSWRILQIVYSVPCTIFLSYYWFAPESVRWLQRQGRSCEARILLQQTARINKKNLPDSLLARLEASVAEELTEEHADKTYTAMDLFRYPVMRLKSLILMLSWVVCASLYYVLLLDQTELSDNPFAGFFMTCAVQIPGYVYVIFTLERPAFGRKRSLAGFLLLSGLMLFLHPLLKNLGDGTLSIVLSVIGRFSANCSYTILHLFSAEQYPTVVRGIGIGFSYVASRLGSIVAPYVLLLGDYSPLLFGFGAMLSGALTLLLPETLGKPLPESLLDGEKQGLVLPCRWQHCSNRVRQPRLEYCCRLMAISHTPTAAAKAGRMEHFDMSITNLAHFPSCINT